MSIEKAYDCWSEQYDTNLNKTRDLDQKATIQTLDKYPFKDVLELGCGTGKNTLWLASKAQNISGLDFSDKMLAIAKQKILQSTVTFKRADITKKWDIKNQSVDLVTCSLTLEHIDDLNHIFSQAHQKLIHGGLFFISELHPIKQYTGSKARYQTPSGVKELEVFTHHVSDYLKSATLAKFELVQLTEWFDDPSKKEIPRLISFVFKKSSTP
jgi:ubiquinone/menaquinone biosynthesis C-methylase UbiE